MGFLLPLPAARRECRKRNWEDQPRHAERATVRAARQDPPRPARRAPLKRWPPKAAAILDRRSHSGSDGFSCLGVIRRAASASARSTRCSCLAFALAEARKLTTNDNKLVIDSYLARRP
jgi:hypothetical protein